MEIEVNKKALYGLLEKLIENRTPSNDNINRLEWDNDEPITPIDMMSTQLAQQRPDVSDPEYVPGNKVDLAAAASVIANEVPESQIDFYYRKLHKLLDIALDRNYEAGFINEGYDEYTEDQLLLGGADDDDDIDVTSPTTPDEWEQIEDALTPTEKSLMLDVKELYNRMYGIVSQLKKAGMDPDDIQQYKNELGIFFDTPQDDTERAMQIRQILNYAKQDIPNFIQKINDIADMKGVHSKFVELAIIGKLTKDKHIVPSMEMRQLTADEDEDISAIQYASQLFDAILARLTIMRHKKNLSSQEAAAIQNDTAETISKLMSKNQIDVSSVKKLPADQAQPMEVSGDFVAQKLQAIVDDHLGQVAPVDMGIDVEPQIVIDKPRAPKQKLASLDDAKTFTDMASFLGFSGASGARQWFLKHVNSKFSLLLHTMENPDDAGPGLLAYKDAYSQTLLQIIDLMTTQKAINAFKNQYPQPQVGTAEYYALNALIQDLQTLATEADKVGNILDVKHPDAKRLNKALRTHIADAIKGRHTEIMKAITTHILDKAAPGIIVSILQKKLPNENPEILKKLHEYISGKSNRPDFDAAEIDKTTQKFINLGIGKNEYLEIVQEYMEELDEALEIALLAPDRAVAIYGNKAAAMLQRIPDMSKLWQKVDKKSKLNKKAIFDIMEEAFLQYKDEYEKTKEHDESAIKESIAGNLINILQEYL